jgi:hypothetical protein
MIEAGRNAEPSVDARIVFFRDVRNALRFQKGDELIAPDIEKDVSKTPAFLDLYRIGDDRFEAQNSFVKLTGLVEVEGRETDMGKSSMGHGYCSWRSDFRRRSVCGREVRVEVLTDLRHLFADEPAAGQFGDLLEVVVLPGRQAPIEHARCRVADVLEAVDDVARDEDDGAGADGFGPVADGQLVNAVENLEDFFVAEMDVVEWTFTGLVPSDDDRDRAAGGLGGELHFHVEAERLDHQRLLGRDDGCL